MIIEYNEGGLFAYFCNSDERRVSDSFVATYLITRDSSCLRMTKPWLNNANDVFLITWFDKAAQMTN